MFDHQINEFHHLTSTQQMIREVRNSPNQHRSDSRFLENLIRSASRMITEATREEIVLKTTHYEVRVVPQENYGWFERNSDGSGGGLWFRGKTLIDYDGQFALHREVVVALAAAGYEVHYGL